jgi:hypothetical protein
MKTDNIALGEYLPIGARIVQIESRLENRLNIRRCCLNRTNLDVGDEENYSIIHCKRLLYPTMSFSYFPPDGELSTYARRGIRDGW